MQVRSGCPPAAVPSLGETSAASTPHLPLNEHSSHTYLQYVPTVCTYLKVTTTKSIPETVKGCQCHEL